jgi:carbon monoxide dehydrogenase subunit G
MPIGMTLYRFVTFWQVDAPIDAVWDAIVHPERWPEWWPGVLAVDELARGDESGIGNVRRYAMKSRLPYALTFQTRSTRVEKPYVADGAATGELEGTGRWRLGERDGGTLVRYEWDVRTTQRWMNLFAPLARPIFEINHHALMRRGGEGLGRWLGVRVRYGRGTPDTGPLASVLIPSPAAGAPAA